MARNTSNDTRQLGGEMVIPILAIAFTVYYFSTIWNSPWTAQVSAFLIGGLLLALCVLFLLRCTFWLRSGEGSLGASNLVNIDDVKSGRLGLFAATILFCVLIERLGFTLTTFLFLFSSMAILSKFRNLVFITGISALISLIGWAVFILAFDTRFPRGWFERTMQWALGNG